MKKILVSLLAALICLGASADEGMWLLPLLKQMNKKALKEAGCRLSPDEIYSINKSSLKDAIVQFGGGCTGEIISDQGLLVTNHHCGYNSIQGLSTPEHNYLMDGYWALDFKSEIPVPGLSVTFMKSMRDVTDNIASVRAQADEFMTKKQVDSLVKAECEMLEAIALSDNPGCKAEVTSFYNDNIYYLIVYKVFNDIRFVGAPPASVGKYGGETDNWMWPRHTGDFSMFRVYAGADNEPAEYSEENRPYRPERALKISLKGVKQGDYTMILGYPGRTQRFQTAAELRQMIRQNRIRIDARTIRQDIMWDEMLKDKDVQLQYANKYAGSANGWKKWQGEELAFDKLQVIERQEAKEDQLDLWINENPSREKAYAGAVKKIADAVEAMSEPDMDITLITEAPFRIELVSMAAAYTRGGKDAVKGRYRDYCQALDKREAVALLNHYARNARPGRQLEIVSDGFASTEAYVDHLFTSAFASEETLDAAPDSLLVNDPAMLLWKAVLAEVYECYGEVAPEVEAAMKEGRTAYAAALLEWKKGEPSYPDANFTMRLTYGKVKPYSPADGIDYRYYTTVDGVIEKADASNPEFQVPDKLWELCEARDYGRWKDADGTLHTCFLTNNDITGGNSGSPVLNAKGELIGLAFDGNWESMSSDVIFEPALQRCICVDIRYVLFLVEKLGGCSRIIDEVTFAK